MRVSDVADAFLNLQLHPDVWPFFFFRFFGAPDSDAEHLYLNTCAGRPGRRAPFTSFTCGASSRWLARSRF